MSENLKEILDESVKVDEADYSNISQFVLSQDFDTELGIQSELMAVAIRKPKKTEWFRVHPTFSRPMIVYKADEGEVRGEFYIVTPAVAQHLKENVSNAHLVLCVTRTNVPFFWPVGVPTDRENMWRTSAVRVMTKARTEWVRCVAKMDAGCYEAKTTTEALPEPEFPDDINRLLALALEKRGIASVEHEAIKHLLTGA
jgi:hypothetical protein